MKQLYFSVALFFLIQVSAQNGKVAKTSFGTMYLPVWSEAKEHCLEVAKAMPDSLYRFKPTEKSKSFAEQMVHIGYTIKLLTQRYVEGKTVVPKVPDASVMDKSDILDFLEKGFDYTEAVIKTISEEQLQETCVMYHSGNTVSRAFALFYVQDHLTNHRAKANLYLRLNAIEPPAYTW